MDDLVYRKMTQEMMAKDEMIKGQVTSNYQTIMLLEKVLKQLEIVGRRLNSLSKQSERQVTQMTDLDRRAAAAEVDLAMTKASLVVRSEELSELNQVRGCMWSLKDALV
jgi:hypothetical protein